MSQTGHVFRLQRHESLERGDTRHAPRPEARRRRGPARPGHNVAFRQAQRSGIEGHPTAEAATVLEDS
jgi:hypothetical protein